MFLKTLECFPKSFFPQTDLIQDKELHKWELSIWWNDWFIMQNVPIIRIINHWAIAWLWVTETVLQNAPFSQDNEIRCNYILFMKIHVKLLFPDIYYGNQTQNWNIFLASEAALPWLKKVAFTKYPCYGYLSTTIFPFCGGRRGDLQ